jgi:hypothetical protein
MKLMNCTRHKTTAQIIEKTHAAWIFAKLD